MMLQLNCHVLRLALHSNLVTTRVHLLVHVLASHT